jgi:hypothetical protein
MTTRLFVLLCVIALGSAAPAWAQTHGAASAPASARSATAPSDSRIGGRVFGHFEWQTMAAKDSFDAVIGKTTLQGAGGGVEVQRLWRGIFVRASLTSMSATGERVFVFENEVIKLGIPLEVSLTPIDLAVGWRLSPLTSLRIVPYAGAGAVILKYKETSDADASGESVDESYRGVVIFGGLEVPVWRFVSVGGEVGWRQVNVPDPGGAFASFTEKDLGGVTMRVMLSIRR